MGAEDCEEYETFHTALSFFSAERENSQEQAFLPSFFLFLSLCLKGEWKHQDLERQLTLMPDLKGNGNTRI